MAKSYYSLDEAREKLDMTETQIKELVRAGKLREFRDAGKVNYRVDDVEKLASNTQSQAPAAGDSAESGSGELVLEPADETGIDLAASATSIDLEASGTDVISLAETDLDSTATGADDTTKDKKEDTVITSVGVSVFEDDEAEVSEADPVAETVVSEGGLGIEGVGSGSGLLDLTRESDDTSLGAELLDEIYPGEGGETSEMGEDTRAGLEEIAPVAEAEPEDEAEPVEAPAAPRGAVVTRVEFAPDPWSIGLTGLMGVAVLVLCVAGLSVAAMMHGGVVPSILNGIYSYLWLFGLIAVALGGIATVLGFFLGKRAGS
jgi:hypothetical protein